MMVLKRPATCRFPNKFQIVQIGLELSFKTLYLEVDILGR